MTRPTAIDLFAGAGGLSLGLRNAGFDILAAVDNDPAAVRTYQRNIGTHIREADIENVDGAALLKSLSIDTGECVLLAGGPPCQGFSLQRRGSHFDERNFLVLQYVRLIEEIRPTFFLMENVGGILGRHGKHYLDALLSRTREAGYETSVRILNAVEFGVPQFRKRAFIIGQTVERRNRAFEWPRATLEPARWMTVREAHRDLPAPPVDGSEHPDFANHYRETRLSALNIERLQHVPPGGGRLDIPDHLQLACHRKNPTHRHHDVYGRLAWDEPAGTLTARFDSFTRGRFGHPVEDRTITLREGARLQTFPDDFVFEGSREEVARQIGNAVPPLLAQRLGQEFIACIGRESYGTAASPSLDRTSQYSFL